MRTIQTIRIEREWAMPNHRTFQIPPIKKLIEEELSHGSYLDPFPFESKIDCFDFFKSIKFRHKYGVLDPPYTKRQVSEHYKKMVANVQVGILQVVGLQK